MGERLPFLTLPSARRTYYTYYTLLTHPPFSPPLSDIDHKLRHWSLLMPRTGRKEFEWGMKIFKHIMLGHKTNFRTAVRVWKNPQDIHKEIHIILSVISIKIIRSRCWAIKLGRNTNMTKKYQRIEKSWLVDHLHKGLHENQCFE